MLVWNHRESRVLRPNGVKGGVELSGALGAFDANGITGRDFEPAYGSALEKDDAVISRELAVEARTEGRVEAVGTARPIGSPVERATVTEQDAAGFLGRVEALECPLHVINRGLSRFQGERVERSGESARKQERRRLRYEHHAVAELAPEEIRRSTFSASGAAS